MNSVNITVYSLILHIYNESIFLCLMKIDKLVLFSLLHLLWVVLRCTVCIRKTSLFLPLIIINTQPRLRQGIYIYICIYTDSIPIHVAQETLILCLIPKQKSCHFADDIFTFIFLKWNVSSLWKFHRGLFTMAQWTINHHWFKTIIAAGNGFSHMRRQTITCSNNGPVH